jgi:protein-disulfide isomerase
MTNEAKVLLGISLGAVVLAVAAAFMFGNPSASVSGTKADAAKLVRTDSFKTASGSAKVTLVEFGDYQCPTCGHMYAPVKQLIEENKGQVSLVFRNFPLIQIHQNALQASYAAEAAGSLGKFWEMHGQIYENQPAWSESSNAQQLFIQYAKNIGLDETAFTAAMKSDAVATKVSRDLKDGTDLGVNGTPTFFINGQQYYGPLSYDGLKKEIDSELKK